MATSYDQKMASYEAVDLDSSSPWPKRQEPKARSKYFKIAVIAIVPLGIVAVVMVILLSLGVFKPQDYMVPEVGQSWAITVKFNDSGCSDPALNAVNYYTPNSCRTNGDRWAEKICDNATLLTTYYDNEVCTVFANFTAEDTPTECPVDDPDTLNEIRYCLINVPDEWNPYFFPWTDPYVEGSLYFDSECKDQELFANTFELLNTCIYSPNGYKMYAHDTQDGDDSYRVLEWTSNETDACDFDYNYTTSDPIYMGNCILYSGTYYYRPDYILVHASSSTSNSSNSSTSSSSSSPST